MSAAAPADRRLFDRGSEAATTSRSAETSLEAEGEVGRQIGGMAERKTDNGRRITDDG